MQTERRSFLRKFFTSAAALLGIEYAAKANANPDPDNEKVVNNITNFQEVPLFSGSTRHGKIVYIAGKGAHVAPFEIKAHTEIVLQELEK